MRYLTLFGRVMGTSGKGMAPSPSSASASSSFLPPQESSSAGENGVMRILQIWAQPMVQLAAHLISNHRDGTGTNWSTRLLV